MVQFSDGLLDQLVGPNLSLLRFHDAPEIDELPNYFGSYFLNNIFLEKRNKALDSLTLVFLRRLAQAVREYRSARDFLASCVVAQSGTSAVITSYLRSTAHFEQAVIQTYIALMTHNAIGRLLDKSHLRPFKKGDGSAEERLCILYNAIKHFHASFGQGASLAEIAPLWLTPLGLSCRVGGSADSNSLTYHEFIKTQKDLIADAKFLSEEVYVEFGKRSKLP